MSGSSVDLEEDLSTELDIVGRINPDTVWDYIAKMKKTSTKDIVILKLQTANDEEKMQYIALYSYLSSRNRLVMYLMMRTPNIVLIEIKTNILHLTFLLNEFIFLTIFTFTADILYAIFNFRLGVVKASNMLTVKDFYIVPLPANTPLPAVLLPLDGPGIGDIKTHLLIAIVIRQRKKRLASAIPTDVVAAKVSSSNEDL